MYSLDDHVLKELFIDAVRAAVSAGNEVMKLFNRDDYEITMKSDNSPVSLADKVAHKEIESILNKSRVPILSEEGRDIAYDERKTWDIFWIIDPLDGTRQFIKKRKEFTVNIALIIDNYPEFGVIYAPAYNELYFGHNRLGSFKAENINVDNIIDISFESLLGSTVKMPSFKNERKYTVLASPNHTNHTTLSFIDGLENRYGVIDVLSVGSSLKMCLLSDGKADVYIRHADTYEWDTAAAQAILEGAGCSIKSLDAGQRLVYNKENMINPWFICEKNTIK